MSDGTDIEQTAKRRWKRRWYTDAYLWIGLLLVCGSLGVYLRSRGSGSPSESGDAAVGSSQMLNIKWRKRGPIDRPPPASEGGASSELEGLAAGPPADAEVKNLLTFVDPAEAGWDTEEANEAALAKLKKVGEALKRDSPARDALLAPLLADDFACTPLRPIRLERFHQGERFVVERGEEVGGARAIDVEGFGTLLDEMLGDGQRRLNFKIVRVERLGDGFRTRVLFEALVTGAGGARQINASWSVSWRGGEMTQVLLETFEQVRQVGGSQPLFEDVTAAAFDGVESFGEQFLRDNAHWAKRLVVLEGTSYIGHLGIAVGDINGDGLDDLYVPDGGGLPNRM